MKRALIVTAKVVSSTPRVLRELKVLADGGWTTDTVGFGGNPDLASKHFSMSPQNWAERFFAYMLPSFRLRFELLLGRRFRKLAGLRLNDYNLIIFHEPTFFPLRELFDPTTFDSNCKFHVDLHEFHLSTLSKSWIEKLVFDGYRKWEFGFLDQFIEANQPTPSITSCSDSISQLYRERWDVNVVSIRNAPQYASVIPKAPSHPVNLVHHGVGMKGRFHDEYIDAMSQLNGAFELHFYLLANPRYIRRLGKRAKRRGVGELVHFHEPVPTAKIAETISRHDIALVVIPPITRSQELALPNKLFESIQAALAVISGPNTDMATLVLENDVGYVLTEFTETALSEVLSGIKPDDVLRKRLNAERLSRTLNSESEMRALQRLLR